MTDVWSPLADEDPVPGDPWRLGDLANHFDARAGTIRDVIRGLERLRAGEGEMQSVAVDELVAQRDELLPHLRLLETRWERTAGALRRYCPVLERAQEMAATARRQSWEAQREIDRAQAALEAAAAQPPPPVPAQPAFIAPPPDHGAAIEAAQAAMQQARRLLEEAVELRDRGEHTAAEEIDDAAHDDLRNRGGFFNFVGDIAGGVADFAGDVVGAVADVAGTAWDAASWVVDNFPSLKTLSNLLSIASGICAIVALFFPPAGVVGAAIGAAKLVVDIGLMAQGEGDWWDIGLGVVSLATFGVGTMAASAARARAVDDAFMLSDELQATVGRAGALAGRVSSSETGTRLTGAALRSNHLRRFREVKTVLIDRGTTGLSRWVHSLARFDPMALPTREMLDLCPSAVRATSVATKWNTAIGISDVESVWGAASTASGGVIPSLGEFVNTAEPSVRLP